MNSEIREKIKELEKNSFISLGTWGASSEGAGNSKLIIMENVLYKYSYNFSILNNENKEEETISEPIEITKEKMEKIKKYIKNRMINIEFVKDLLKNEENVTITKKQESGKDIFEISSYSLIFDVGYSVIVKSEEYVFNICNEWNLYEETKKYIEEIIGVL